MGMSTNRRRVRTALVAAVLAHLVISIAHGTAHTGAHVPLSLAASLFVYAVILAGPFVGLALVWLAESLGTWVIMLTMAGSLVFGVINHFVFDSPDHVSQVEPQWRLLFATTAVLLAATEVLGVGLAHMFRRAA
jgi:hypothetical protein